MIPLPLLRAIIPIVGLGVALIFAVKTAQGSMLPILGIVGIAGVAMGIVYQSLLFPLLMALMLFPGGIPVLKNVGYWDLVGMAICGICLEQYLRRDERKEPICNVPLIGLLVVFNLMLVVHFAVDRMGWGDGSEGGERLAAQALIAMAVVFFYLSGRIDASKAWLVPWLAFGGSFAELGLELLNFFVPAAIPYTYSIYSSLNHEVFNMGVLTGQTQVSRLTAFRSLGFTLVLLVTCHWMVARNVTVMRQAVYGVLLAIGLASLLFAGYRGVFAVAVIAIAIAVLSWRPSYIVPGTIGLVVLLFGLSFVHSNIVPLPNSVQRTVSWVPGDWDEEAVRGAREGFGWRGEVWTYFYEEIFPEQPWLGRGRRYFQHEDALEESMYQPYWFALRQLQHNGFFSSLDYVGIVGTTAFTLVCLRGLYVSWILVLRYRQRMRPWQAWLILYFVANQPLFWVNGFFDRMFYIITVVIAVLERELYVMRSNPDTVEEEKPAEEPEPIAVPQPAEFIPYSQRLP